METDLNTHNTSPTAHGLDQYVKNITQNNNGLTITKGGTSTVLNLFTNNKEDTNTNLAPTLAVVKELLGNVNLDIEEVLKSKGVRYDFSNENAWYICLGQAFGGLIIQGGNYNTTPNINIDYENKAFRGNFNTFPISFPNKCFHISASVISKKLIERQGPRVLRPAYAYSIDNATFMCGYDYTFNQDIVTNKPIAIVAIGI